LAEAAACNGLRDSGEDRNQDRGHVVSGFLYEEEYVSLALDSDLDIAGNSADFTSGAVANSTNLITYTNAPNGYSLSIASQSDSGDLIGPNGNRIAGVEGTLANPVTLSNGTWGFGMHRGQGGLVSNDFSLMPVYSSAVSGNQAALETAKWAKIPPNNSPLAIRQTDYASETGQTTNIFYGLKTDVTQPGGTYSNTVVYTVVGNI
jgi:hypothetical protein